MTGVNAMREFRARMAAAVAQNLHHDQRRAYLMELLRDGYGIEAVDVELERNVWVAEARGRIDLLYRRIVFEVKRDLDKERDDVLRELKLYLTQVGEDAFGLATDGRRIEAYRLREGDVYLYDELNLEDFDDDTAFAWVDAYLFAQEAVVPSAEDVVRRFGPQSPVYVSAQDELHELWAAVEAKTTVDVKRAEWDRLLRMVYGTEKGSDELFIRHTYLALVARLFAYLAIAQKAPPSGQELDVILGTAFEKLGIENLVEEDFFAWVAEDETKGRAVLLLRGLARHLSVYATERIDEDLLKQLYETLVDPVDRHDLGEYYTPDWLADLVLREADYGPGVRAVDPACGSGTFLFSAIRLLREQGLSGAELVEEAQSNLIGFDVHPLAVTTARANFVLALRADALAARRTIHVPVWMADSLAVPEPRIGRPIEVTVPPVRGSTAKTEFFALPTEMEDVAPGSLEEAIKLVASYASQDISDDDAVRGLRAAYVALGSPQYEDFWVDNLRLFRKLVVEKRDTVWAFILKNAVRPQVLSRRPVDLVMGNPPWLPVRSIAEADYQDRVTVLALGYNLLKDRRGWQTGALELATVFAAFSADHYLKASGTIAFVLPRGVLFGAKQHDSFRRFAITVPLSPVAAFDLRGVDPLFRVPACAAVIRRARAQPGEHWMVREVSGRLPRRNASHEEATASLTIGPTYELDPTKRRSSPYFDRALQGATLVPRPFWFVQPTAGAKAKTRWVRTDQEQARRAKMPWKGIELEGEIESRFFFLTCLAVYPYRLGPLKICALPIEVSASGRVQLLSRDEVARKGAPAFHRWLVEAEGIWAERKKGSEAQAVELTAYLDNHANLTRQRLGRARLMYGGKGTHVRAVVVDTEQILAEVDAVDAAGFVFDMNMYYVDVDHESEAHYLAAIMNTPYVDDGIKATQTSGAWGARDIHRRPFEFAQIPEYDPGDADHVRLVEISRDAHTRFDGMPYRRSLDQQLAPIADLVPEADALARRVCD
jgi:hypothetical protein